MRVLIIMIICMHDVQNAHVLHTIYGSIKPYRPETEENDVPQPGGHQELEKLNIEYRNFSEWRTASRHAK